jgi:hypothetical protein
VGRTADGFIAVGSEPAEGQPFFGLRQGVVWTSGDGMTWQRSGDEAFANATLLHVAEAGDTTYLLGVRSICILDEEECLDLPDAGLTVWREDGGEWLRLPQSDQMRDAFLAGVVVLDETLIAFGDRPGRGRDVLVATVWVSEDGIDWQEVSDLAGLDPISAAAVGPDGLVAFGTRFIAATDSIETVAAFSEDGRTFQQAALPPGMDVVIESIAYGDEGFVAAGAGESAQFLGDKPAILRSTDGRSWSQVALDDSFAGIGLHQVRELPEGYLLIGFAPSADDPQRDAAISWVSRDGETWSAPAPLEGGAYRLFSGSAVGPEGAVAFVLDYEEEPTEGPLSTIRAWFAPAEALRPR